MKLFLNYQRTPRTISSPGKSSKLLDLDCQQVKNVKKKGDVQFAIVKTVKQTYNRTIYRTKAGGCIITMSIEVGSKLKGKVTGIKKFGAFVELPEGKSGLVHISEVADNYVENVEDHLTVGDEVEVKVLSIADDGKISLSIKKAKERPRKQKTAQKPEDFEKKLSNFLKDSEDRLTSIKRQTESRRGGRGSRR